MLESTEIKYKLSILKKHLPLLAACPYTRAIFLAGSLATGLAQPQSDIDLIVVAQKNRVWLNKFFLETLARIFKIKRTKNNYKNKICFNIFLANVRPLLPHQDFTGASFYKNLKPVWGEAEEIKNFWRVNSWIRNFYSGEPAREKIFNESEKVILLPKKIAEKILTFTGLGFVLEKIFYKIQTGYLKNKLHRSVAHRDSADYDFFITPDLIAYHFPLSNYARAKKSAGATVENRPAPKK